MTHPPPDPHAAVRMGQLSMFDGVTYDPAYDDDRLRTQLGRVFDVLWNGEWFTLAELRDRVGGSEAGISARLRDLRKPKFGGYVIARRRRGNPRRGLWEYRLERREGPGGTVMAAR